MCTEVLYKSLQRIPMWVMCFHNYASMTFIIVCSACCLLLQDIDTMFGKKDTFTRYLKALFRYMQQCLTRHSMSVLLCLAWKIQIIKECTYLLRVNCPLPTFNTLETEVFGDMAMLTLIELVKCWTN